LKGGNDLQVEIHDKKQSKMKVTLYRYEKETLVMRSVEMEKLQAALRTENLNKPVSTTRDKAMFALPGTQNSYIQKLPVVVFGGTFRKTGEPAPPMRDYSGLVLLEVNHLSDLQEAVQIRQQAAMMPQTLLAFVGFSGKSVKIVIPFTLPDGTLPRSPEQVKRFHSQAYLTAVKYYQPQLGRNITLKEPVLQHGCRMSYDPQPVYNPDAVAIRIEQPMRMADSEEIRIVPEEPSEPLQRLMPGMSRNYRIATLFSIAMVDAIRKSGQIKDGDLKPVFTLLADNCLKAGIPEEDAVQCTLLYNDLRSKEMEIRMTFRSVYTLKEALAGKTFMPEIMSLTLQLEEFMLRRYEIRNNKMSGEVEYRDKSLLRFTFSPFTREVRNSICTEAHKEGLNVWDKDIVCPSDIVARYAFGKLPDMIFAIPFGQMSEIFFYREKSGSVVRVNISFDVFIPDVQPFFVRFRTDGVADFAGETMGRPLPQMVPQYGSALVRVGPGTWQQHYSPTGRRPGMRQIDLLPEHPASRTAAVLHRQHRFQQAPGYGVGFAPLCPGKHRRVRFRQGYAPKLPEAYPAKSECQYTAALSDGQQEFKTLRHIHRDKQQLQYPDRPDR